MSSCFVDENNRAVFLDLRSKMCGLQLPEFPSRLGISGSWSPHIYKLPRSIILLIKAILPGSSSNPNHNPFARPKRNEAHENNGKIVNLFAATKPHSEVGQLSSDCPDFSLGKKTKETNKLRDNDNLTQACTLFFKKKKKPQKSVLFGAWPSKESHSGVFRQIVKH